MSKDMEMSSTVATEREVEPIIIESMWRLYTEERLIPMTFKPTGETVYVTPQMYDWIERGKKEQQGGQQ